MTHGILRYVLFSFPIFGDFPELIFTDFKFNSIVAIEYMCYYLNPLKFVETCNIVEYSPC